MKNKVLITIVVPSMMKTYDMYIPVNEYIYKIKEMIINSLSEMSDNAFDSTKNYNMINAVTGTIYEENNIVRDTDISNSTKIVIN